VRRRQMYRGNHRIDHAGQIYIHQQNPVSRPLVLLT
jgi:hypothetical protein